MRDEIISVKNEATSQIVEANSLGELETLRADYLGKNGKLTLLIKNISKVKKEDRRKIGALINETKASLQELIASQKNSLKNDQKQWFDPTIPGNLPQVGNLHAITKAIKEISDIFEKIGFVRVRYPEIEWDWFAFGSLNFPHDHPARDEWETFFIDAPAHKEHGPMLLTPHTSSGQVREMRRVKTPPIRMINISKCYRRQSDASHFPTFHQFEGLVIDNDINITHLKGTLDYFARQYFGEDTKTRIRPYDFLFTEPSFEVDVTCSVCRGKGCKLCKEGWLEIGGSGMVHPNVLRNGGIDPSKYSGFAFGWGVERVYMMKPKMNIPDLRILYSSDFDVLKQF